VPAAERTTLEVLRDDRPVFARFVEARRNRSDDWYLHKAGYIDVCNISVPVQEVTGTVPDR
jgi:peptidylprolyl isomerase